LGRGNFNSFPAAKDIEEVWEMRITVKINERRDLKRSIVSSPSLQFA
jgi:hypothetical protein